MGRILPLLDDDPADHVSLVAQLAEFFRRRPGQWIDGRELAMIAGAYAWRSRVSELRRPPFSMTIVNRQRHVRFGDLAKYTVSEYRYLPEGKN